MNRPDWVTNEQNWLKDCAAIKDTCRSYLSGALGLIEASREICKYAHRLRVDRDPAFSLFILVDSDTDHLPVGKWREGWAADSLIKKDQEVQEIEAFYKRDFTSSILTLLSRFDTNAAEQDAAANP